MQSIAPNRWVGGIAWARHARSGCAIALVWVSGVAAGQSRDGAAAEALFRSARAELDRGNYASACQKFAESNRLDPAPGTVLNLGLCLERIGKLASAWEAFRQVSESVTDERRELARRHAAQLEPRLPWLTLSLPPDCPDGTRVSRDGVELRGASLRVPLPADPGVHWVVVDAPGHQKSTMRIELGEGERRHVVAPIGPALAAKPASGNTDEKPPQARATSTPHDQAGTSAGELAWIAGGVGVAGIATSLATGALALSQRQVVRDHCEGGFCDNRGLDAASSGRTYATVSTVSGMVGLVGIGVSSYLFLSVGRDQAMDTRGGATASPRVQLYVGSTF